MTSQKSQQGILANKLARTRKDGYEKAMIVEFTDIGRVGYLSALYTRSEIRPTSTRGGDEGSGQ
jgi:hypothetical protein